MKLTQATNRLRAMIQSLWGASNISTIHEATGEPSSPPKPPPLLKLECHNRAFGKPCGSKWESATFSDCPGCGQRKFVHKVEEAAEAV